MIVARFENASRGLERNKEIRQELAHEIDEFLNKRVHRQTPRKYLMEAELALSKCDLPLTKCIFQQESGLVQKVFPKPPLSISPTVAVSVVADRRKVSSTGTQFSSLDPELTRHLEEKFVQSLESIRDGLSVIAEKHQKHKLKNRALRRALAAYH